MKRLFIVVPLCIIIAALLACGSTSNTGTTSGSSTAPATSQHFKVGDTVTVGSTWKTTANGIKTDDGGQFSALKSGDTYVLVDISLTNLSGSEQNVSSLANFTFKDSTGQKYDESIDPNVNGGTPDGKVASGDTLRGTLTYEVPASQKAFTLAFAPDITSSGQTIWDLSLP
jgi:hypothetical protein